MTRTVFLSIVIPVRDRWGCLGRCLDALAASRSAPPFEVIIVDDGSSLRAPSDISEADLPGPLRVITQQPMGISAARNRGIAEAVGEVILFIDSDCRVHPDCLRYLACCIQAHPTDLAFQLQVTGDNTLVGQMERLRVESTIKALSTDDNHVSYANTSGFALRRSCLGGSSLFDVRVVRGEDTLLLQRIIATGNLPRYASEATVVHAPPYSPVQYTFRHLRIGYHSGKARRLIMERGPIFLGTKGRRAVLSGMWRATSAKPKQVSALGLCLLAYALETLGRRAYTLWGS